MLRPLYMPNINMILRVIAVAIVVTEIGAVSTFRWWNKSTGCSGFLGLVYMMLEFSAVSLVLFVISWFIKKSDQKPMTIITAALMLLLSIILLFH